MRAFDHKDKLDFFKGMHSLSGFLPQSLVKVWFRLLFYSGFALLPPLCDSRIAIPRSRTPQVDATIPGVPNDRSSSLGWEQQGDGDLARNRKGYTYSGIAVIMVRRVFLDRRIRLLVMSVLILAAGMAIEIYLLPHYGGSPIHVVFLASCRVAFS